jgi:hypothetical protein
LRHIFTLANTIVTLVVAGICPFLIIVLLSAIPRLITRDAGGGFGERERERELEVDFLEA